MVKSKKMSKTSIAVIVLAILLVLSLCLGLTGAWFTANDGEKEAASTLKFGSIGDVEITLTGASAFDSNGDELNRDIMPGDRVTAGGIRLTYTAAQGDDNQVYYVVYDGAEYYTLSASGLAVATQPGTIKNGTPIAFAGNILSVSADGEHWFALDGAVAGAAGTSSAITNAGFEGVALSALHAQVGGFAYKVGSQAYGVGIIQMENAGENGANVWPAVQAAAAEAYATANA